MDLEAAGTDRRSHPAYRLATAGVALAALALLCLNLGADYARRHEDNNALYATFARAHVQLGLAETRAHDLFVSRETGARSFYAHHPPGVGLALALAFQVTGRDNPAVVRSVAVCFHLAGLLVFLGLCRRLLDPWPALAAGLLYAVLPAGAFYGRMANHEPLALPFMILLVSSYFAYLEDGRKSRAVGMAAAVLGGGLMGWVTFFAVAACALHGLLAWRRGEPRARRALAVLTASGGVCLALLFFHIYQVAGGDLADLRRIFFERIGAGKEYGPLDWVANMADKARRLFSASGVVAAFWVLWRVLWTHLPGEARPAQARPASPAAQAAAVFLAAGLGYMVVFNWGAWQHQYWQLPLLPGVAIAATLGLQRIFAWRKASRSSWALALAAFVLLEVAATAATTLRKLHTRDDPFVVERVEQLRRHHI